MWLVQLALRRPHTFVVMGLFIVLAGVFSIRRMPTDVFPRIDVPVVAATWVYAGMQPEDMEKRIVANYERILGQVLKDVDHIESLSVTGTAVVKIYLQPGADVDRAMAAAANAGQVALRTAPPGTVAPLIFEYSATAAPVIQIAFDSDSLTEQQLYDVAQNYVRPELVTINGVEIPFPYGGRQRTIMIDIDPERLHGSGLSPRDIQEALAAQNVAMPTGTAKLGTNEFPILISSSPATLEEIAAIPVRTVNGRTLFVRDIANVRDGSSPQTNMVHVEGRRSVLTIIRKTGEASTLEVVDRVREVLPHALERLPKEIQGRVKTKLLFDQSVFVRAAIESVLREALIAAGLTALMVLAFLGSWRSTVVVLVSIPLSILFSFAMLDAFGQTINAMTLGGLALAVGVLIDDATVEIENIHRNIHERKPLTQAILDGARQVAIPALVSTLCICIVFAPIAFLSGAARSLFIPMAIGVVCAMLMSYLLSRTLVPTVTNFLLAGERGGPSRFTRSFEHAFEAMRSSYGRGLAWALRHRGFVVVVFAAFVIGSGVLAAVVGRDFFPTSDAGLIRLHVRGAPGTRIEETEKRLAAIERTIRDIIPPDEIDTMLDVIGAPYSAINLALSEGAAISSADAQIQIALRPGHRPTGDYIRAMRTVLNRNYPSMKFFFLPPDISTQALNFGLPAPIDLQVTGAIGSEDKTLEVAKDLEAQVAKIAGAVDVHLAQIAAVPAIQIDLDRAEAQQAGLSARDISTDVLASLASSGQFAPTYFVDKRGVLYLVSVQTPQYSVSTIDAIRTTPISTRDGKPQTLGNVAKIRRTSSPASITHYDVKRTFDVQASVADTDLGSVVDEVERVVAAAREKAPKGTKITIMGQAQSMDRSFIALLAGLGIAIVLVYLLMVMFFQSWVDPLIILTALPGALAGIVWMLFLTETSLSVPALIGSIMCIGVATANSILVVSFANDQRATHDQRAAAFTAGLTRLRPVLMTALAMVLGMLPMAIGIGEGSEQNAPLGRAVIGGLGLATVSTLVIVPVMYSMLRRRNSLVEEVADEPRTA